MTAEPAGQLAGALTLTGQLVTAARDGQWADPAPGPGWPFPPASEQPPYVFMLTARISVFGLPIHE